MRAHEAVWHTCKAPLVVASPPCASSPKPNPRTKLQNENAARFFRTITPSRRLLRCCVTKFITGGLSRRASFIGHQQSEEKLP
ncbi:hypothetical protein XENOCAPTIV_003092 [Xenoophorus captivus]|uniref:Secreted protein n=1 Tax=Xenoophorus captivus TaxID=1517983 RepID=A0ABV0SEQ2_9TELE